MNYREKLNQLGITRLDSGRQVCPQCSSQRSNKKEKCLRVTFEADAIKYHCHHCEFEGVVATTETAVYMQKKEYKRPEPIKPREVKNKLYEYFEKRGISQATVEEYKIFQDDKGSIVFPYFKNGELVNNKTRFVNKETGKKGFIQSAESEQTLYGMDNIPTNCNKLIWVEGEFDVLSFYEVGEYAVSPNQGGGDKKLDCFENCFDFIQSFDEHIIAVDNDEVGKKLEANLKERLSHKLVKIVDWSIYAQPNKDANDFLARGEKSVLKDALISAKEIKKETLETFNDCLEEALQIYHGVKKNLVSTGWSNIDQIMQIQTGRLMVVSGISKLGKSFWVDNLLFNLSNNEGWRHFVCSFEGDMNDQLLNFAEMETGKNFKNVGYSRMSEEELVKAADKYSNYIIRLKVNQLYSIEDIIQQAEYAVLRYGVKTITIDPYNKLKHPKDSGREDKHIEDILSKMIMFAKKYNVLVIFVAHPRHSQIERPTLSTISGGGAWHSMADYGIIIHRRRNEEDELSNVSEVFIEKVKSRMLGNPNGGVMYLAYEGNKRLNPTEKPEELEKKEKKKW